MALVLHQDDEQRKQVVEALESVGYQVFVSETAADAIERMRFVNFSCIAFYLDMEGGAEKSSFHAHMCRLPMDRRRFMFYILLGSSLHTLYDLEALACSANLTVNTSDIKHLDVILRKAIPAYEELFGTFLEELEAYGRG
jgi:CheY-like chemotaxis protein